MKALIRPDQTAGQTIERQSAFASYACIVIGSDRDYPGIPDVAEVLGSGSSGLAVAPIHATQPFGSVQASAMPGNGNSVDLDGSTGLGNFPAGEPSPGPIPGAGLLSYGSSQPT
jgi:hypothetical protein